MLGREEDEAQSVVDHLGPLGRRRLGATASLAVPAAQDRSLGGTQHLREHLEEFLLLPHPDAGDELWRGGAERSHLGLHLMHLHRQLPQPARVAHALLHRRRRVGHGALHLAGGVGGGPAILRVSPSLRLGATLGFGRAPGLLGRLILVLRVRSSLRLVVGRRAAHGRHHLADALRLARDVARGGGGGHGVFGRVRHRRRHVAQHFRHARHE
mmetsp:Transcript_13637/g.44571  ORF Transcript_13637/g.44571 Transcript_13637/m.44571 type:complete len:212 (-) Transcript_13637:454-1089(-)